MTDPGASEMIILILLMSVVTYLPRALPVLLLSRRQLPEPVVRWLSYVPVAVLAALLAPALFVSQGALTLDLASNPAFWVSIPVFGVAIITRNLFATVLTGMALIALVRYFLS